MQFNLQPQMIIYGVLISLLSLFAKHLLLWYFFSSLLSRWCRFRLGKRTRSLRLSSGALESQLQFCCSLLIAVSNSRCLNAFLSRCLKMSWRSFWTHMLRMWLKRSSLSIYICTYYTINVERNQIKWMDGCWFCSRSRQKRPATIFNVIVYDLPAVQKNVVLFRS